jgi:hypothetical protein
MGWGRGGESGFAGFHELQLMPDFDDANEVFLTKDEAVRLGMDA